ncbi:MAG: tRNA (adenosine(37)-N6)-threonylcarbamoyltransferase complex ATPase subunit type 1 TsaE [Pseudomonadota bacterium]
MIRLTGLTETQLHRLAADLALSAKAGDCFALSGELGAGKTSFARAFIRSLGEHSMEVPSPTFTIVQQYDELIVPVSHYDLYRIADPEEMEELGLDDALRDGVVLVEWPEMAPEALPTDATQIIIENGEIADELRNVTINNAPDHAIQSLAIRSFLKDNKYAEAKRAHLTGDASSRRYENITNDSDSYVLMVAPRQPDGPPIRNGKPYSQLAHLAEDIAPFIVIGTALADNGLRAPEILGFDIEHGFLLLEDLGGGTIVDADKMPIADRYIEAAKCLAKMHEANWSPQLSGHGLSHALQDYDLDVFLMEASLLTDWFVPAETGSPLDPKMREEFETIMSALWRNLRRDDYTILLRDYHSPNIIFDASRIGTDRIGIIDFQDALWGPAAYDVMSLAHDARVDIPTDLTMNLVDAYCKSRSSSAFDEGQFRREASVCTAQRLCKILGIFHRLNIRDGKPSYLAHLPRVRGYFEETLNAEGLEPLADWWRRAGLAEPSS